MLTDVRPVPTTLPQVRKILSAFHAVPPNLREGEWFIGVISYTSQIGREIMNKQMIHRYAVVVLISFALVALLVVGVTMAQSITPAPTEPGAAGAAGPEMVAYDSATSTGLPPDDNPPADAVQVASAPQAIFSYYHVAGATLRGRSSTTSYEYANQGCTYVTSGTGTGRILNTELTLPDGAVIKYLRVYYKDASSTGGVKGYITRYRPGEAAADLVWAGSTASYAGGYGYVVSTQITETVNNTDYAYTLIGWPDEANSASQICGLRVAYYAPKVAALYLPMIRK